jgi:hypothetical protein
VLRPRTCRSPSSTNPAAAASDIRNPSSNNPAAAASDLRRSRAGIPSVSSANRSGANGTAGAVKRGTGVDAQRKPKQHAAQPKNPLSLNEPAASRKSDRALPKSCDDRATEKELSGDAKAAFITDCRNEMRNPKKQQALRPLPTRSRVSFKISNSKNGMPLHGGPWGRSASDATVRSGSADPRLVRHQRSTVIISNPNSVLVLALGYDLFGAASIHARVLDLARRFRSGGRRRSGQSIAFNMR